MSLVGHLVRVGTTRKGQEARVIVVEEAGNALRVLSLDGNLVVWIERAVVSQDCGPLKEILKEAEFKIRDLSMRLDFLEKRVAANLDNPR